MKTVTIYTDGHKNRNAVLCGMSVLLAPSGQPQNMTSKQAPSHRCIMSRGS